MTVAKRATNDLNRVLAFVAVVEAASFTAAAKVLGQPKSSVSRAVSGLEKELGIRLLRRTTRRLGLTDAGRTYFEQVRPAIAALQDAGCAVAALGTEPRGLVRLTAPADGGSWLTPALAVLRERYPEIRVELSLTERKVDLVQEGFDLAVRAGKLEDSSLIVRRVGEMDIGLYGSPAYLKAHGRPRKVADLAQHPCILFRSTGGHARWTLTGPGGAESVEVQGALSADQFSFIEEAVAAGLGIGFLPELRARSTSRLTRVLPDHVVDRVPLSLVSPTRGFEPVAVTRLRELLVAQLTAMLGAR